jgi:hypothetical protein
MNNARPGILAVRAVNQYRRRDVLTYLGDFGTTSIMPQLVLISGLNK